MKFVRTDKYEAKLFKEALMDNKNIIKNATVEMRQSYTSHMKAYCPQTGTFLQFPKNLRFPYAKYTADVVEVMRLGNVTKYYRAVKHSIRKFNTNELVG